MRESAFTAQITGFPANVSNPQGGKSTDFSAGKCHLLYFVVVPESLIQTFYVLRGPAAILFISRDSCSDSIAKPLFVLVFMGYRTISRDMLQNGVSHRYAFVRLSARGGVSRHFGGECQHPLKSIARYAVSQR